MQILKIGLFIGLIAFIASAYKPSAPVEKTKWLSLDEAAQQLQKEKRPVLIDLYTDWCGWCKVMDKRTYANKQVSAYLAQKFYPVKIDAEGKNQIKWNSKVYRFNEQYRTNDFALYLTGGNLSYPTTVIIPANGDQPQAIPGFLGPKDFEVVVKYFGEGYYGKLPFSDYQKSFKSTWK
jgi:thioredoxin-related protein